VLVAVFPRQRARKKYLRAALEPGESDNAERRTMTVIRDDMNSPMAETINRMSDQNLQMIIRIRRQAYSVSGLN
jgi:hypothetical protein